MAEAGGGVGGAAEPVAPGVRRLTAPNPGPMTATGTNCYLIGAERVALIDPGPADAAWRATLLAEIGGAERLAAILVSHSHLDHSAGAAALAAETGAPVYGFGPHGAGQSETMARLASAATASDGAAATGPGGGRDGGGLGGGEGADRAYRPDRLLADGDAVEEAEWRLSALHTPGHLGNHLCFALTLDGRPSALFSGDHVMGWATSLVSPPDGDMGAFMASLERLAARQAGPERARVYLPGHGAAVADPDARIAELLAHRRGREAQIAAALGDGPATAGELAARIYTDVDPRLLGMAARNVLSHLIDLAERGRAAWDEPLAADARFRLR